MYVIVPSFLITGVNKSKIFPRRIDSISNKRHKYLHSNPLLNTIDLN